MRFIKINTYLIFYYFLYHSCTYTKFGLVKEPLIDLLDNTKHKALNYNNIPLSPVDKKDSTMCPRLHQLLFNEVVKIIKEEGNELIIEITNAYYQSQNQNQNKFRTLKKNIITFEKLKKIKVDLDKIPKPISFSDAANNIYSGTCTLILPFFDSVTKKKYSAGTRFVYSDFKDNNFTIYIFDPKTLKFAQTKLNKNLCIKNEIIYNKKEKIYNFIKLLKNWANKKYIPYVWGGCSFIELCNDQKFDINTKCIDKKKLKYYSLPTCNFDIKSGFDCSGLILRAAQICQLPFFFKNSTTIANNLKIISPNEKIQEGDLIWISGHIMIVSDLNKNLIIEASDYSSGYGKVQEIELKKVFKNINNFKTFKKSFFQNKPLNRLNNKGEIIQTIKNYKILKMNSLGEVNNKTL